LHGTTEGINLESFSRVWRLEADSGGHPRSPSSILRSAIDKLVQVKNADDRMRLEYVLLGSRMSLEERRRFDAYCVAGSVDD
jgi:hypothetical protein